MNKVLIIGANGKIGRILIKKLQESADFLPVALIRKEEQKDYFEASGVDSKIVNLEDSIEQLVNAMNGIDAVVFTAGSGGNTGYDKTLAIDLDGAVKSMKAAKKANIRRYIMVSAIHADNRKAWENSKIKPYYIAKHYADHILKSMDLDYTILRPGRLFDKPGTGKITTTNPESREGVSREDVASLIMEALANDHTIGKIFKFNEGDIPIKDVVDK